MLLTRYLKLKRLQLIAVCCCVMQVATVSEAKSNANSKIRPVAVDSIVLHAVGGPYCKHGRVVYSGAPGDANRWRIFFEQHKLLGIHYIVDRRGRVLSSISVDRVANHALGWNERSIGIELVNDGDGREQITNLQWSAALELVKQLIVRYPNITASRVFRHSDIDRRTFGCAGARVKQKQDPGWGFNYAKFIELLG